MIDRMNERQVEDLLSHVGDDEAMAIIEEAGFHGEIDSIHKILDYYSYRGNPPDTRLLVDSFILGVNVYEAVTNFESPNIDLLEGALRGAILGDNRDVLDDLLDENVLTYLGNDLIDFAESSNKFGMADYIHRLMLGVETY